MKKLFYLLFCAVFVLLPLGCDTREPSTCTTTEQTVSPAARPSQSAKSYITAPRETESVQKENPALQEKIDRYAENRKTKGKAILVIGEMRDVPHQRLVEERYIDESSGEFMNVHNVMEPTRNDMIGFGEKGLLPVYTVKEGDTLHLYENDVERTGDMEIKVLKTQDANDIHYESFRSLVELYDTLPEGQYDCYIHVRFNGNYILYGNGEPCYDEHGAPLTETYDAYACFILDLQRKN